MRAQLIWVPIARPSPLFLNLQECIPNIELHKNYEIVFKKYDHVYVMPLLVPCIHDASVGSMYP